MPRRSPTQVISGHPANPESSSTASSPPSGQPPNQKPVQKRVMANERERERTRSLNKALEILRNRLPVPEAEKRSKIQTLRMAKEYIEFLAKFKQEQLKSGTTGSKQQGLTPVSFSKQQQQQSEGQYADNNKQEEDKKLHYQVDKPHHTHHTQQPDTPLTYKFYKFRLKAREPLKKSRAHVRSPSEHASDNESFHTNNLAWPTPDFTKQQQHLHT